MLAIMPICFCNLTLLSIFTSNFNRPQNNLTEGLASCWFWQTKCDLLLSPGPVWICFDSRCWGGQRHPQSSTPVKPEKYAHWPGQPLSPATLTLAPPVLPLLLFDNDDDWYKQNWPKTFYLPLTWRFLELSCCCVLVGFVSIEKS